MLLSRRILIFFTHYNEQNSKVEGSGSLHGQFGGCSGRHIC